MPSIQLRDYQQQAVQAAIAHFKQHVSSAVIVLPTGAGKSLVIAELARQYFCCGLTTARSHRKNRGCKCTICHTKQNVAGNANRFWLIPTNDCVRC
jgi:hypothetical protein